MFKTYVLVLAFSAHIAISVSAQEEKVASTECSIPAIGGSLQFTMHSFHCGNYPSLALEGRTEIRSLKLKVRTAKSWGGLRGGEERLIEITNLPPSLSALQNYKNNDFWRTAFFDEAIKAKVGAGYTSLGIQSFTIGKISLHESEKKDADTKSAPANGGFIYSGGGGARVPPPKPVDMKKAEPAPAVAK